jgi:DNA anti-recombination protein RmuC
MHSQTPTVLFPVPNETELSMRQALHHYFALFAQTSEGSNDKEVNVNDTTNNLLERARKLRQEISTLESDKIQTQKQRNEELQVVETEKQMQQDDLRTRYTVIIPILKDMGDEVMERVSFSPIFKGGKILHLHISYSFVK